MRIDFNKLRTFITVAEEGSVTKAAAILHVTQQAVSRQISALEDDLEMVLFVRANRKIFLTPEGISVLEQSKQRLCSLETDLLSLKKNAQSLEGTIIIGAVSEVAHKFVLPLLKEFKKLHPNVYFEIRFDVDKKTEDDIINGEIDLGFLIFTTYTKQLKVTSFAKVPYVAVASKAFTKKHGPVTNFSQTLDLPFVDFLPSSPSFRTWLKVNDKSLVSKVLTRRPDIIAADEGFLKSSILEGLGIGVIPKYLVEKELEKGILIEVLPKSKSGHAGIDLVTVKRRTTSNLLNTFVDFALENRATFS
jgi:DNA-binding transcriptional LysR family regulator